MGAVSPWSGATWRPRVEWITLEDLYKKYNYVGITKLYTIAKKEGLKTTIREIQEFIEKQHIAQVHSTTKNKKNVVI
jgi:hypothetical protein